MDQTSVWLGIDIGTTSVKVSVVDDEGKEIFSRNENTNSDVKSDAGETGFEQCSQTILKVVEAAAVPVFSTYKTRIRGIGITGQMHGLVLWRNAATAHTRTDKNAQDVQEPQDEGGASLDELVSHHHPSHLYTWQDQRCTPAFLATLPEPSNSRLPLCTGHGCATLFSLARSGSVTLDQGHYDCCGTIMDFLVYILCGIDHPITSDQLATSLGYFNQNALQWDSVLHDTPEFPSHLLPSVLPAGTRVGVVRPSLSQWPQGVPVLVAMGDVQCAMGAILKEPYQAAVSISTSIQLGFLVSTEAISSSPHPWLPSISFFPFFGGRHLALCAGLNGGNAIHHFVECVAGWMRDLGVEMNSYATSDVFSKLVTLAADRDKSQKDSAATHIPFLAVRPTFYGERHDPTLGAEISNISLTNFQNIGSIFRSVCEGVVYHLATMVPPSFLQEKNIRELFVCGSVPEKNPHVKNALKSVYSKEYLLVDFGNGDANTASSAVGAARFAKNLL